MRTAQFQHMLVDLNGSTADIEASALISVDGLMMASAMPQGMDEDRVGAMSAALLSLGERTARELARGSLERVLVQGEDGYVIMTAAAGAARAPVPATSNACSHISWADAVSPAAQDAMALVTSAVTRT